eukprot:Nitzschia sp. Nitz4//scaffold19_size178191//143816//144589//NITZ4_002005-RA/size178191-processed-gene-0.261-mRNA-1//1//CDS//3329540765//1427//frame0
MPRLAPLFLLLSTLVYHACALGPVNVNPTRESHFVESPVDYVYEQQWWISSHNKDFIAKYFMLHPPSRQIVRQIKDRRVRRAVQTYCSRPMYIFMDLRRSRRGKKAEVRVQKGWRGEWMRLPAYWDYKELHKSKINKDPMTASYEDAKFTFFRRLKMEVTAKIPYMENNKKMQLHIVYHVPMRYGLGDDEAKVPIGGTMVRIEKNRFNKKRQVLAEGSGSVTWPMRNGVVDKGFAQGRLSFRAGRRTGMTS